MPKVKISFPDASVFKGMFDTISKLIDEVKIVFEPDFMQIRAMDTASVAMVDVRFPKEAFTEYQVEEATSVGVNLSTLVKALKKAKRGDKFELETDDEQVVIRLIGTAKKEFRFRNMEVPVSEIPEAKLEFDVKLTLLTEPLKQALKDAQLISESVTLYFDGEERLVISATGETKYEMTLTKASGSVVEAEAKKEAKSTYNIEYLINILSLTKLTDSVKVEFSSNMPIKIGFDLTGGGTLVYLLAPSAI